MIGVNAEPILPAFGPVPTAVDMLVTVFRRKHEYKKKKKKNSMNAMYIFNLQTKVYKLQYITKPM